VIFQSRFPVKCRAQQLFQVLTFLQKAKRGLLQTLFDSTCSESNVVTIAFETPHGKDNVNAGPIKVGNVVG
jgi:hypothetical protein